MRPKIKIAIFGGGFGLYGYLPALLQIPNFKAVLLSRYQERVKERGDISHFYNEIEWVSDEKELIETCNGVIVALESLQQYIWVGYR